MIKYLEGDMFCSPAQTIVNTVNTVGVMGKGIALSFKNRYPQMFEIYKKYCDDKLFDIGKLILWKGSDYNVLLFPTKKNWRDPSKIEYIEAGLEKFVATYEEKDINSIAFPRLGCGNGGLDWSDVRPLMEKYLNRIPIPVYIYVGTYNDPEPEHKNIKEIEKWLYHNAKDMSFSGLCSELRNHCFFIEDEFVYRNSTYSVKMDDSNSIFFTSKNDEYVLDEDNLHELWDDMQNKDIMLDATEKGLVLYSYLTHLGYLTRVRCEEKNRMVEGYQLYAGLGRAYDVLRRS